MADADSAKLRLIRTPGVGPVTYRQLLARFATADAALDALPTLARRGGGGAPRIADSAAIEREMATTDHARRTLPVPGRPRLSTPARRNRQRAARA